MISYLARKQLNEDEEVKKLLVNHPPWALPLYVVDTGDKRQVLYFCQNLFAVSWILQLMGNGEDRAPGNLTVSPYIPTRAYVESSHMSELLHLFIKADKECSNWVVVFEYKHYGIESEILSP